MYMHCIVTYNYRDVIYTIIHCTAKNHPTNAVQTLNCKLQTANCKPKPSTCELQTADCRLQTVANRRRQIADSKPQIPKRRFQNADSKPQTKPQTPNRRLQTSDFKLQTPNRRLQSLSFLQTHSINKTKRTRSVVFWISNFASDMWAGSVRVVGMVGFALFLARAMSPKLCPLDEPGWCRVTGLAMLSMNLTFCGVALVFKEAMLRWLLTGVIWMMYPFWLVFLWMLGYFLFAVGHVIQFVIGFLWELVFHMRAARVVMSRRGSERPQRRRRQNCLERIIELASRMQVLG